MLTTICINQPCQHKSVFAYNFFDIFTNDLWNAVPDIHPALDQNNFILLESNGIFFNCVRENYHFNPVGLVLQVYKKHGAAGSGNDFFD